GIKLILGILKSQDKDAIAFLRILESDRSQWANCWKLIC
ncbi:MAG: hypothetical protein RLZZ176_3201, partial [Cyanobacteriota bacterium]